LRLAAADVINFRNNANSGNLSLAIDGSDNLLFNGVAIVSSFTILDTNSIDLTLAASVLSANVNLSAAAADAGFINAAVTIESDGLQVQVPIADTSTTGVLTAANWNTFNSKQATISVTDTSTIDLTLTGAAISADIKPASIDNSMIAVAAAIAYSKLNLTGNIVNADINASAAIARSKVAAGTADHVVINAPTTGVLSSEATLAKIRGGTAQDNTNLTFPSVGTVATTSQALNVTSFGNLAIACSVSASALTIALKQADGSTDASASNPVSVSFRDPTIANGNFVTRTVTGALSVTVPSGATLGLNSGTNGYIYVFAIDNGGTIVLGVNSIWLPDAVYSTFNLTTASDTAASGPSWVGGAAALSCKMIARLRYSTAPNGTYSAVPTQIDLGSADSLMPTVAGPITSFLTATSSIKTPSASAQYHALSSNSIVLQPGNYCADYSAFFNNGGTTPTYAFAGVGLTSANGADSGSVPTAWSSTTGVTMNSTFAANGVSFSPGVGVNSSGAASNSVGQSVYFSIDRTLTIFVVTYSEQTTAANARVSAALTVQKIA
jgi:hypothetical protein